MSAPAFKVRGKLLACVPTYRSAEPGSLVVRVDFEDRADLLAAAPDVYYVTDHYLGYIVVLMRLSRVTQDLFAGPGSLRRSDRSVGEISLLRHPPRENCGICHQFFHRSLD
jgi:hypothetical protein